MPKHLRALPVAVCLTIIAGSALASTRVGTLDVSDQGLPYVIEYCEKIASLDPHDRFDFEPSLSDRVSSGVSLKSIQLSDCQRAGLL